MFKICDKTGWTYSFSKTEVGSIEKLTWSSDGTLCGGACGDGSVIFG
jgi:intraflagellar transport protein 80